MRKLLLALAIAGCKEPREVAAPAATIEIGSSSSWSAERSGDAPMLRGPGGALLFVTTGPSGDRMPGLALGSAAGPELSLLAGEFAPLVVPDRTGAAHTVRIESISATLSVDFAGAFSARVLPPEDEWVRIVIEGRANLVLPSGETTVKGFREGRPTFREKVSAWSEPSIELRAADRIEVDTERRGSIVIESKCAPRLIRPRARANTSSFLLRLGPARDDFDPRYTPQNAQDPAPPCTGTATISMPVRGP